MIMLRTMSAYAPLIPSGRQNAAAYVTKLGQFLRLTSLDELPKVFNILNGSITFIGPRSAWRLNLNLLKAENVKIFFSMTRRLP